MTDAAAAVAAPTPTRPSAPPWEPILLGLAVLSLALIPLHVHRAFGLQAHPLIIHVPVVLVPLVGLAALALVARPAWMERWGVVTGVFAVVATAGTILAVGAGQALRDDRGGGGGGRIEEHAQAGETLRIVMICFALALLATLWARRARLLDGAPAVFALARVVVAALAIASIFFVVRTGHLGAQLTWDQPAGGFGGGGPPAGFTPPGG